MPLVFYPLYLEALSHNSIGTCSKDGGCVLRPFIRHKLKQNDNKQNEQQNDDSDNLKQVDDLQIWKRIADRVERG